MKKDLKRLCKVIHDFFSNEENDKRYSIPDGFTVLGKGCSRIAMTHRDLPGVVFKYDMWGGEDNFKEVQRYKRMRGNRKHVSAVLYAYGEDSEVIVHELISGHLLGNSPWGVDSMDILHWFEKKFKDLYDLHLGNIAFDPKRNAYVIIDYAD